MIELNEYFNSKLMTTKEEQKYCRDTFLDCGMRNDEWHMFDSDSLPSSMEKVSFHEIPFIFPDKKKEKMDAISCEGTEIEVPAGKYSAIYLLGTAFDQCSGSENICIHYESGKTALAEIYVKEWYYAAANTKWDEQKNYDDKCTAAIFGKHLSDLTKRVIYYMPVENIDDSQNITMIELPFNPDIYIMAVTLAKRG